MKFIITLFFFGILAIALIVGNTQGTGNGNENFIDSASQYIGE
jgi:hypothetical protein